MSNGWQRVRKSFLAGCCKAMFAISLAASMAGVARAGDKNIFDDDWTPPKPARAPATPPAPVVPKPPEPVNPQAPVAKPPTVATPPPGVPAPVVATPARRPIPDKSAQDQSRKLMREIYAKQLADKSAAGRRKLAQELLKEADKVRDNPVDQYVLLAGAIEAAKEGGSLQNCVLAADAMGSAFAVDGLALKADAAAKITPQVADVAAAPQNVAAGLELVDQLTRIEDFNAAARVCTELQALPGLTPALRQTVQQRMKDVGLMNMARDRYVQAVEKLKSVRDDPGSNLAIGTYLCFCRNDWTNGLPFLARAPDSPTKTAALADVANPQSPDARIAVGDAWWTAAEKEAMWQTAMKLRAVFWYQAALDTGKLNGLIRVRIEKRIAEVSTANLPPLAKGSVRHQFLFKKQAELDSFNITGNATVRDDGGLLLTNGTPSLASTKQRYTYPLHVEADVFTLPKGNFDIRIIVMSPNQEAKAINVTLGNNFNKYSNFNIYNKALKFDDMTIVAGRTYHIVIDVDERRKVELNVDGKVVLSDTVPGDIKLEGNVVLSGGRGSVVYTRCLIEGKPVDSK